MQSLYNYISVREREEIAETPIEQAMKNYRETRGVLLVVYAVLVIALVVAGVHTLYDATPPPSSPAAGVAPSPVPVAPLPAKRP
ncbi:heme/copper-type cytochrome/quinol oxidase subunit 2 [Bradyrhizobium sp. USDA 4516]